MKEILLKKNVTSVDLKQFDDIWALSDNAVLEIEHPIDRESLDRLCLTLLNNLHFQIARDALADIADSEDVSDELLFKMIELGDTEIMLSIALRKKIPKAVWQACVDFEDPDLQEHIAARRINNDLPLLY